MLKQLQNRLRVILIVIFMTVVSLILCFSFWNTWQAHQTADITYIQRMASLIIYQLEADTGEPEQLLSDYEKEMSVYSMLKDDRGQVLFQSTPDTLTDLTTLGLIAENTVEVQSPTEHAPPIQITSQGGYEEITGNDHDRYYMIPASISTKSGHWYSLILFYEQHSAKKLLLSQIPAYGVIWIFAFLCIFFASRFLLRRAFEPTERVLKGQKDFVAAASHELKSPLAVIMANVESIQSMPVAEPELQNDLQVIDSECMRMSRLVRDMLLLASSDADKWTIHPEEVDIDTLLITLYEAYEPICRDKDIHLGLDLGKESYPKLRTDRERLFQILSIFLDNAVSYSPKNNSIEIQARQTTKEITFFVIDHGNGIDEKDKPFIFDRFYCADQSRTDKSHFGLGLSIAKELANMLAGQIGFADTDGGGATFFLTLDYCTKV